MSNLSKINVHHFASEWRVWLPHQCSPDEPTDGDVDQVGWGDFYFTTFDDALWFVRRQLRSHR